MDPRFYGSVDGKAQLIRGLYGSVDGKAKAISKLYGSVNGRAQLIYKASGGGGGSFNPVDPNNVDLDNLSNIVKAGVASQYLAVGDLLDIPMADGTVMKRRVLGFDDRVVQIDGVERTVPAIQCENALLLSDTHRYDGNAYASYSRSELRDFIINTITPKESVEFIECLGNTKIQTATRGAELTDTTYDKMFVPSSKELGATQGAYCTGVQSSIEGPTPTYYVGADDPKRLKKTSNGSAEYYNTRSVDQSSSSSMVGIDWDGGFASVTSNGKRWFGIMFNFIGKY